MPFSSLRDMAGAGDSNPFSSNQNPSLRFLEFSLRLSVIPLTVASLWVMARNRDVSDSYGKLEYKNLTVLKYLVGVNALSAAYSFVAIVFSSLRCFFPSDWFYFVSDQVMAYLMVTSGSAVAELLYLAYKGDREVSWSEACTYHGRFCSRAKVSMALHFIALVCFLALSLISGYRVFSKFEPPIIPSKEVGEQVE